MGEKASAAVENPLSAQGNGLDEQQQQLRWQAMAMENERLHRELTTLKHSQGQEDKGLLLQQQQQIGLGLAEITAFETRERTLNDQLLAAEAAFHTLLQRDATTWLHIESFQSTMKKFFRFQIEEDDMRAKVDDVFRLLDTTRKQGAFHSPLSAPCSDFFLILVVALYIFYSHILLTYSCSDQAHRCCR